MNPSGCICRSRRDEATEGAPSKWTKEELDVLERTLREHETWLNEWVEKQKTVKMNEDPVIETAEMKARAKVLETQLSKLIKRKTPKRKVTTTAAETTATTEATSAAEQEQQTEAPVAQETESPQQENVHHDEL